MASHLSSVGFPITGEQAFIDLAERLAQDAEFLEAPGGGYLRWRDPAGVELWLPLDEEEQIVGLAPHFDGASRVRVGLTARAQGEDDTPFDGRFTGWVNPPGDDPEDGAYPLVFDCPDFAAHGGIELPHETRVQIAAFAGEIEAFPSAEAFEAKVSDDAQLSSQAFIPAGMFTEDFERSSTPEAIAVISGHVKQAETRRNEHTGEPFHYAFVESYEATFDVVIDPELLPEPPVVGGVVMGMFWLSGRLVP